MHLNQEVCLVSLGLTYFDLLNFVFVYLKKKNFTCKYQFLIKDSERNGPTDTTTT